MYRGMSGSTKYFFFTKCELSLNKTFIFHSKLKTVLFRVSIITNKTTGEVILIMKKPEYEMSLFVNLSVSAGSPRQQSDFFYSFTINTVSHSTFTLLHISKCVCLAQLL